jgi:flavin-dependent dehydrogenase
MPKTVMTTAIRNITIVGGGTSGWLAALYFVTHLKQAVDAGDLVIKVIESPNVPIIGVGESLSPSMPVTLQELGVSEASFIRETDASFKLAGHFVDWDIGYNGRPTSWVNPFVGFLTAGYEFERFELKGRGYGEDPDYARTISPCRDAIELRKAPRSVGQDDYSFTLRYAYHTDASKFAPFMRDIAISRGVQHVLDNVTGVELDERGFVATLNCEFSKRIPVELVIDATGFSSVVLHKALGVPWVDYSKHLLNDKAVVMQLPDVEENDIEPATRATALRQGWAFRVPLYSRTGNGYVYSSKFTSDEIAARDFVNYLGPHAKIGNVRTIPMRVGRAHKSWVKNCIAIGLAAGFVEPLEASAIYSVETSLKWILNYFPDSNFSPMLARRYNERTEALYDEVVEYIVMHYRLSNRSDSDYWVAQRNDLQIPDRLAENLELWKYALPVRGDLLPTNYFDHNTYIAALFGKGFYTGGTLKPERQLRAADWLQLKQMIFGTHTKALNSLPGHRRLIESIRAT